VTVTERQDPAPSAEATPETPAPERLLVRVNKVVSLVYWVVSGLAIAAVTAQGLANVLRNTSLRYDEINVIVSIVERPYATLHPPLEYLQSAPVGWLWMEKALTDLFGSSEMVLRAPALIATPVALVLAAFLARRMLPPVGALVAVLFLATNYYVGYYAYDAKPYSLDMVCSVALVLTGLAARRISAEGSLVRRSAGTIGFWTVAAIASWFSFPAVFCTAAIALVLGVERLIRGWRAGGWRPALRAGLAFTAGAIPWFVVVAFDYVYALGPTAGNSFVFKYFASAFPAPGLRNHLEWLGLALFKFGGTPLSPGAQWIAIFVVIGAVVLLFRRTADTLVLIAPLLIGFVLAFARIYPMTDRLAMYALPIAALTALGFTAVPLRTVAQLFEAQRLGPAIVVALVVVVAAPLVWRTGTQIAIYQPQQGSDNLRMTTQSRELLTFVKQHWKTGDVMVATPTDEPAFRYYAKRLGLPSPAGYVVARSDGPTCSPASARPLFAHAKRVWSVTAFGAFPRDFAVTHALFSQLGPKSDGLKLQYGEVQAYDVTNPLGPDSRDPALQAKTKGQSCLLPMTPPFEFPPPAWYIPPR
jgi:hypothetical protein